MADLDNTLVVAIDGGGTRCRVGAFDGHRVVSVETGSANASTDLEGSVSQIKRGLGELATRLACSVQTLRAAPAFVGLAGVTGPAIADALREALKFQNVRITDDRLAAVRGGLGKRDGVLAHCGTGSFFAAQVNGAVRFAGGWGPVLGDEASAQWVGRRALGLALECEDGRIAATDLSQKLLTDHTDAAGVVRFASVARPVEFGAIAPLVTGYAGRGDAVALKIMQEGAGEIVRALRHLGWRSGLPICLTGGIGSHYAAYLPDAMRADLTPRVGEPLDGAIALAKDVARGVADDRD
ncbi:ATPase [Marivita sp. S6314]|nr:BadF/BadG/BcrA/BcrD ATPase family protein [Marivita sp. S6314]MCK0150072.1 ATPase [Marivita sp. S6314]